MPWCPKCKNEYVEGMTYCSDCKCDLVDNLENEAKTPLSDKERPLLFGEEEALQSAASFLEANQIPGSYMKFNETDDVYELFVEAKYHAKATKVLYTYVKEQKKDQEEEIDLTYVSAKDKAVDSKSSGKVLIGVGAVGIVVLILIILEIIPVHMSVFNLILTSVLMGSVFILLIVMGVLSLKSAKKYSSQISVEEDMKKAINEYCTKYITKDAIDQELEIRSEEEGDEEKFFFLRTELLKKKISEHFPDCEPAFVEEYIDSHYDDIFA